MNEESSEALATALNEAGYPVTARGLLKDSDAWNVASQIEASPSEVTAEFFVERLVRLASIHEAEFDGWGMSL